MTLAADLALLYRYGNQCHLVVTVQYEKPQQLLHSLAKAFEAALLPARNGGPPWAVVKLHALALIKWGRASI